MHLYQERPVPVPARRRVIWRLAAGAAAGAFVAIPVQAADGPAASLIEKTSTEVIELIKNTTGAQREAGIRKALETSFDLPYMGQAALAPHWTAIDEAQRGRYLKTATSAEAHPYSNRLRQSACQTP